MDRQGSQRSPSRKAPTAGEGKMSTAYREPRKSIFDLGRSGRRTYTASFGSSRRFGDPPPPAVRSSASRFSAASKGTAAWAAAEASTTSELYQRLQVETGWTEDIVTRRYAQVIEYRLPLEEDLDNETYVDIVNRQGQPYIRNIGILRYLGPVRFDSGTWWAGIELDSHPVPGGNDGCLDGRRYFTCDTGLGMFIPQRYCRRSFLQRSRHDANVAGGAFSRLRLDHRGVWLVEEVVFQRPSAIQSLRDLGVEPYEHVPHPEAEEAEEAEEVDAAKKGGAGKASQLLVALAYKYKPLQATSGASLATGLKGMAAEAELDSSGRTVEEAFVVTTGVGAAGEQEVTGGDDEDDEAEDEVEKEVEKEAVEEEEEPAQDALLEEERPPLPATAEAQLEGEGMGEEEVAPPAEASGVTASAAEEGEESLFQELLLMGTTQDDRPAAPVVGTAPPVAEEQGGQAEDPQWWRMDDDEDEGGERGASTARLPGADAPVAPPTLEEVEEEEAVAEPPQAAAATHQGWEDGSSAVEPLSEAEQEVVVPEEQGGGERRDDGGEPTAAAVMEDDGLLWATTACSDEAADETVVSSTPPPTRWFKDGAMGGVEPVDGPEQEGSTAVQEQQQQVAGAGEVSGASPTLWLDESHGREAEPTDRPVEELPKPEEDQAGAVIKEERGAAADLASTIAAAPGTMWFDGNGAEEGAAGPMDDRPDLLLLPRTPPPTMSLEDLHSRSHRNIYFSPKSVQVTFTPPRRGSRGSRDGAEGGAGAGQEGREWGEEGEEGEDAWAAFVGMEVTDVDTKPARSPRQERKAQAQQQQHPLHRRSRSASEGQRAQSKRGKRGAGESRGHARSATSVTPPPTLSKLQPDAEELGSGPSKLVGPAELETYYLAAKLYLEENGVAWDDASEAAAFSRKTLFLRLNNIDPASGATPKAAQLQDGGSKTVGA